LPVVEPLTDTGEQPPSRHLRVVWFLFFFQFAGIGVFLTFINVFLHNAGMSGTQIGVIGMLGALSGMVSATLWGYLSDRTGQTRLLLIAGALGAALSAQLYPIATDFGGFILYACLFSVFNSAGGTLVDSLALSLLGSARENYGRYRLGGSIGYILSSVLSGLFYERVGLQALFPTFAVTCLCFIIAACFLPSRPVQRRAHNTSPAGSILAMIRQPAWMILVAIAFLLWMSSSGANGFLSIAIKNMGGSNALVGLTFAAPTIAELPFMAFSAYFIRRFGPTRLLWIATAGYILRFILYCLIPGPGWAPFINAYAGPMYVMYWNSTINLANRMAPPGLAATAQGLIVSATSLAGLVGALLSGYLFDQLGSTGLFLTLSGACFLAFAIYTTGQLKKVKFPAGPLTR
jgi:MFS transporter, PPP family, 3-phenylpropionic acid transporter